jgi:hypothetical protein
MKAEALKAAVKDKLDQGRHSRKKLLWLLVPVAVVAAGLALLSQKDRLKGAKKRLGR